MAPSIVGMVYEGEPYDAHTWSGCSPFFFKALQERGVLHAAFGAGITRAQMYALRAAMAHPNIDKWKFREGANVLRRQWRTAAGVRKLQSLSPDSYDTLLQIGAFYDFTALPGKKTVSYNDTNLQAMVKVYPERADPRSPVTRAALRYEARVHHNTDVIFTMSRWAADTFVRDIGVSAKKVEPVGAGINMADAPQLDDKSYEAQNILFVGRDFSRKGGYTLLRAFERVRRVLPNATLTMIGAKGLKDLPSGVEDLGFVSKRTEEGMSRILAAYRRASVFTLPSIWEPFGISVLEAQAYGLPCVGTNVAALPELIEESGGGLVVPPDEPSALADALIALLKDPLACRQMGRAGRERQNQSYTWRSVARRIHDRLAE